ncbi:hypothetical protein QBC34DRAFT_465881 [Podospora aff. communis PSN243]|uniref:DUF7907 domain-containing protein n=1 Tax=Podospora aff. communis PSN243 TaxID=3040156 RepID=A0AAV9GJ09_9PEZI|nr:hypothetical protein QBC34DRAFT_465881 [Podospora aff. communis PSN243]
MIPLFLLSALATASASPLSPRMPPPIPTQPPSNYARAFRLIANSTAATPNPIFNPPIGQWVVSQHRVSSGQWALALSPDPEKDLHLVPTVFFVNGTESDTALETASIMVPPIDAGSYGVFPVGLQFNTYRSNMKDTNTSQELEHLTVWMNRTGTIGAGIARGTAPGTESPPGPSLSSKYPVLFPPRNLQVGVTGTFAVCKNDSGLTFPGFAEYYLIWVRKAVSVVPYNCQEVNLVAQCAELPELAGVKELNLIPAEVRCYEDVSAVEWTKPPFY